jgi:hypothetical protein
MRQRREPGYFLKRELPPTARPYKESLHMTIPERATARACAGSMDR